MKQENTNINALNFEIDALKKEIKVLKHQKEQMYSEEEVKEIFKQAQLCVVKADGVYFKYETFEQFKKK
jgi:hypothetical protein